MAAVLLCFSVAVALLGLSSGESALLLDRSGFDTALKSGRPHFVKFFAPWCGHCKRLAPTWDQLADSESIKSSSVTIAKVDCTVETALCAEQGVKGYPTLKLFNDGAESKYQGSRDLEALSAYVLKNVGPQVVEQEEDPKLSRVKKDESGLVHLNDDDFEDYIANQPGLHFVKFYAPWCGFCKRLAPTWDQLAVHFQSSEEISIAKIDCSHSKDTCRRHDVSSYPTLRVFKEGQLLKEYSGSRTLEDLAKFIKDAAKEKQKGSSIDITEDSFQSTIESETTFVKFYVPWCGFCKALAPKWEELAAGVHSSHSKIRIASVNCVDEADLCVRLGIHSYPTLVLYRDGQKKEEYQGAQDLVSMQHFVNENS